MRQIARWSGPQPTPDEEQIANARQDFIDLSPVSDDPAVQTAANWSAVLPGQEIPLIWEDSRRGYR